MKKFLARLNWDGGRLNWIVFRLAEFHLNYAEALNEINPMDGLSYSAINVRLLRDLGPRTIWTTLVRDRANSALMTLLLLGVFVLQFGSISILAIEEDVDGANITSASDALWYPIVTISTVG